MLSPPELRKPLTAQLHHNRSYPPGVVTHLGDWADRLRHPRGRGTRQFLSKGMNLHAVDHLQFLDHIHEDDRDATENVLLEHWRNEFPRLDHYDLRSYRDRHKHFEDVWQHESLEWVLDVMAEVPDVKPDPEWVLGERGESYWVRKFDRWPQHSVMRQILRRTLEVSKAMVENHHTQNYGNGGKNVAMKGRPFWLIDTHAELLEQPGLTPPDDPERFYDETWPVQLLVVHEPINSGASFNQDVFVSLVGLQVNGATGPHGEYLGEEVQILERCPTLQIPQPLRDNPEMEVRDAMKLYLSAGVVKNRRIVLEFNKFTTYYAETFGLRHAPVKGGATRYLMGPERAHLHINASPHNSHDYLEIRVEFATEATKAFYGRLVTFLGAFWQHCHAKFGEDLKVDMARSELVDAGQIEVWGNWAYGEVLKRYPNLAA